jgi:hypothetical protein
MHQSTGWGLQRYGTLIAVLALHLAVLAALLTLPHERIIFSEPKNQAVVLLYLPPARTPKVRFEDSRPRRLSGDTAIWIAPPAIDSASLTPSPGSATTAGDDLGVDWKAEARRAVQAYEIRTRHPPNNSLSGSPAEENWWPRTRHRAGDQYKTASGDWIVWISSSCYQVASSSASAYAVGAQLPQTVCVGAPKPPRNAGREGESGASN